MLHDKNVNYVHALFSGLMASSNSKPAIMGIINVSPESFGGNYFSSVESVLALAKRMFTEGADILDIGAMSTAPNAPHISEEEEWGRLCEVVPQLATFVWQSGKLLSIDTSSLYVMRQSVRHGGMMINSVAGPTAEVARFWGKCNLPVIVTDSDAVSHNIDNKDISVGIVRRLCKKISLCREHGVKHVIADPGVGFHGSSLTSLRIIDNIQSIVNNVGAPVLIGASRKEFIGNITREKIPEYRLAGSLCVALLSAQQGVSIVRVHDVKETWQMLQMWRSTNVHV